MKEEKLTGRWTKLQHHKFIEGLKLYGKNWKKIQQYVSTRTGAQVRSHAQKFFGKVQQGNGKSMKSYSEQKDSQMNDLQQSPCETIWDLQSEHSYFVKQLYASLMISKNTEKLVFSLLDKKQMKQTEKSYNENQNRLGFRPYKGQNKAMNNCLMQHNGQLC